MSQPSPDTWRPRQLTAWLKANGLRELEQNLREQGFKTVVDIVESNLTDADLRSLGIEHMKVRKDVLRALANEAKLHIYNMGAYHRMHAAANMLVEPLVALAPKAEAAPAASPVSCWKKWPENFARLAAYKNKHGDCNVPRHWPEDPQLGSWVRSQQKRKSKSKLGKSKLAKLEALGFAWELPAAARLPRHPAVAAAAAAESSSKRQRRKEAAVATRCARGQRKRQRKAEAATAASPVAWDTSATSTVEEKLARLVAYKNKHGDCNVPRHWPEDPQLGDWVRRQRKRKRKMNRGELKGKNHRVDPDFGSALTVSNRDSQSNCWANWKIMGQPCEFQV
jgi:hypothetical protein